MSNKIIFLSAILNNQDKRINNNNVEIIFVWLTLSKKGHFFDFLKYYLIK